MSTNRAVEARAEAERRYCDAVLYPGAVMNLARSAFVGGWLAADAKPHTITRDTFQGLIDYCNKFRDVRAAHDDRHARTDAYAWGFVETAVGEYLWELGIGVEDDDE